MRASNVDTMFLASCSSTCGRTPWSSSARGMRTGTSLPFGQEVVASTKKWENFQSHSRARKKKAWIQGPDVSMSLTSGGHYVVDEDKYMHATDIAFSVRSNRKEVCDAPLCELRELSEQDCAHSLEDHPPRHLRGKQSLKGLGSVDISPEVLQERLHRGHDFANNEANRLEADIGKNVELANNIMSGLSDLDKENEKMELFLKALWDCDEAENVKACEEAVDPSDQNVHSQRCEK